MCSSDSQAGSSSAVSIRMRSPRRSASPQGRQPSLEQVAGVAALQRQVGHDAQRDQVEVSRGVRRPARPLVERLGQLVGDPDAGQISQRMICGQQLGVDDRRGIRQGGRQVVVVGDDHVHPLRAGVGHRLVRGHAGVAGEDQPGAVRDDPFEVRQVDAVRLVLAHRHVVSDLAAPRSRSVDTSSAVAVWPSTSKSPQTQIGSPPRIARHSRLTARAMPGSAAGGDGV